MSNDGIIQRFLAKVPTQNSQEKIVSAYPTKKLVPLVVYKDGQRHVVGEAYVDVQGETFLIEASVHGTNDNSGVDYEALIMPRMKHGGLLVSQQDPIDVLGKFLED